MTAPTSLAGDASDGKTRATPDLRLVSPLVRSWTLLVLGLFQWEAGKSRYARASGSAASQTLAAPGRHCAGMPAARWHVALIRFVKPQFH